MHDAASYLVGWTIEESNATHPDHTYYTTETPCHEVALFFGSTTSARDAGRLAMRLAPVWGAADGGRATVAVPVG